ncbi:MAG: DUF4258 domain-containing protein [Bacteroidia bacterium]|nr:DUF4258 domain-containing protein [Bacteroidia bacterium]
MTEYQLTEHAKNVFDERELKEHWIKLTMDEPDDVFYDIDETVHYIKQIKEFGGRHLRIVTNNKVTPIRIITLFFDRRLKK